MNIQELKLKSSEQLITQAEELGIENASTLRKQEILFAILKKGCRKRRDYLERVFCNYCKMDLVF
jgi:transcription termination factor Rho